MAEYNRGFNDGYANRPIKNPNDEYYDGYIMGQLYAENDLER